PYKLPIPSPTNKTDTLYSGTKYKLITTDGMASEDYLYELLVSNIDKYKVVYSYDNFTDIELKQENNVFYFENGVPEVIKPTVCAFKIIFTYEDGSSEVIYEFSLVIKPNILITTNISKTIQLDDYNNTIYNFQDLTLKKYDTTKEYTYYTSDYTDTNYINEFNGVLSYTCETFTDEECLHGYTTNIVKIADDKLQVISPINELGTYYVKVQIYSDTILIGELQFEITSKSNVANANNEEIAPSVITANSNNVYTLNDLRQMYKLQRNGDIYYKVENWQEVAGFVPGITYMYDDANKEYVLLESEPAGVRMYQNKAYVEGKTYKLENGEYKLMTNNEGNNFYYNYGDLTDILWMHNNNTNLQIVYEYDSIRLVQTTELKYNEYLGDWVEGQTYYYQSNDNYILATEYQEGTAYYTLEYVHKLGYNGVTYTMIGTSYNNGYKYIEYTGAFITGNNYYYYDNDRNEYVVASQRQNGVVYYIRQNCEFDIRSNTFVNDANSVVTNNVGNVYYASENGTSIYCTQNAYLFKNENSILALSIESNGKNIYMFNINDVDKEIEYQSSVQTGNLKNLQLLYKGFGERLIRNIDYVDNIEYTIELVFDNKNIKTNDKYLIQVEPYVVNPLTEIVLAENEYVLYDTSDRAMDKGLFNINSDKYKNDIKAISFGVSSQAKYTINITQTKYTIIFEADGNNYEEYVPITITYNDDTTFTYNTKMTVVNGMVVNINHPYNVEDVNNTNY
ncbi:MAG: hypothetical protein J6Q15_00140, partial [Clostridia bacterium]|nr:hypothetical protein [Clostridia bacterium]